MPSFTVHVAELWFRPYYGIEASSPEEAKAKVVEVEKQQPVPLSDVPDAEFKATMDTEQWAVEQES